MSIIEVLSTLVRPGMSDRTSYIIIWTIRLPIALTAVIVGAALAVAGSQMQTILSNPLASPYTLGVSSAAGFGAALALTGNVGLSTLGDLLVPASAFAFSLLACTALYSVSKLKGAKTEIMILAGIAIMFLFRSLLAFLQFSSSEDQLQAIVFWLFGNLYKATWPTLGATTFLLFIALPVLAKDAWKLTAMRMGDEKASSLGVNVQALRMKVFIIVSAVTAIAVSVVGTIGFVGLVGPHIARMLVGEDQRFFLPVSALSGAVLLSAAAVGSKLIAPGTIVPIGIVTSLIGVPFFVFLVLSKRGGNW